jgi:translation initiation factor IF-1
VTGTLALQDVRHHSQCNEEDCQMPKSDFIETEGTVMRMRGHGFYTVVLANGHEVLARMSGRMTKNHIRVIQDDRVLLEISPADWSQGRIIYRYK